MERAGKGPSLLFTKARLPEIRSRIANDPYKLNLILWGHGEMIAEDPGCIAYGNPRHWEWYRATLAHQMNGFGNGKENSP